MFKLSGETQKKMSIRSMSPKLGRVTWVEEIGLEVIFHGLQEVTLILEKAMAPHSGTFAWKIPWTEEPGGLQSMGSLRVGHD